MGTVPFLYMMYSRSLSAFAFATDKKSSHKIKHRKIPRVHCILQVVFFAFYCIVF